MKEEEEQKFAEFKRKMFDFTKQLVSNEMSTNMYIFFIVIENLQYLAYHCNGLINYNTIGFPEFVAVTQYMNLLNFMRHTNINFYLVPIFTVFTIIHIIMVVVGYRSYQRRIQKIKSSIEDRNFHKNRLQYFINLIMVCYNTIFTIPIFQTSITSIYCTSSNPFTLVQQCYSSSQIVILFFALFNILWLLVTNVYFAFYYYSRNPFSITFLTCSSNWWNLGKFCTKITPMIYFMYDPTLAYPVLFLIIMSATYAGYLGLFRIIFPYYRYNSGLQKKVFLIQGYTCMFNCNFAIIYLKQIPYENPNIVMISWSILSALLVVVIFDVFIWFKKRLIQQIHSLDKHKLGEIEQYLIYLIDQVETSFQNGEKGSFLIAGIAKTHKQLCSNPSCYCSTFFNGVKLSSNYNCNRQLFYALLLSIIDRIITNVKKANFFVNLKAYILFYKMQSHIKAATTISMIRSNKLNFSDDMLVKGLLFQLDQQYQDPRDMEVYRKFNQYLLKQEEESLKLVNMHLQYWEQLIEQKSSLLKLHDLLKKIKISKNQLRKFVEGGLAIFENHVRVLLLYKNILREVLNDYAGYIKCEDKYKTALKQNKIAILNQTKSIQFRSHENILVINMTRQETITNQKKQGNYQIVSISSNVKQFLGFTNSELKEHSINKLIPRIYHDIHDQFVDRVLNKRDSEIEQRRLRIFPLNSSGNLIQCFLISKFMPHIIYGINIVSFFEQCIKCKGQLIVIYHGDTGIIDSLNTQAAVVLKEGTRKNMSDSINMPNHINDLLPSWDFKNQRWKSKKQKRLSVESMKIGKEINNDIKQVEFFRSDGLDNKYIKTLKFRGDYFESLSSIDNQQQKDNNVVNQFLQYQRNSSEQNFCELNQGQEEDEIKDKVNKKIDKNELERQKQKYSSNIFKLRIKQSPSQLSRITFISSQWILFLLAIILTTYETVVTNVNINTYNEDATLLISINQIQTLLSDSTYIISLVATQEAYSNSNMTLPYSSFVSVVQMAPELAEITGKVLQMSSLLSNINPIFIKKINDNQITEDSFTVQIRQLLQEGTKNYYTQNMTVIQATLQFIQYAQDINYRLIILDQNIQTVINSANYFYIFANNLSNLPQTLIALKNTILASINNEMDSGYNNFLIVEILVMLFMVISIFITWIYHRYIYQKYIWRVLKIYEFIRVQNIHLYEEKCNQYKNNLKLSIQCSKDAKTTPILTSTMRQTGEIKLTANLTTMNNMSGQEDKERLIIGNPQLNHEEANHFLNFQQTPHLKLLTFVLILWIILSGIIITVQSLEYQQTASLLKNQIGKLNQYTMMQNSVIQTRLYSQLSINMLNYWDASYLQIINSQLQNNFDLSLKIANDSSLNFTLIKPLLASKYQQFRAIQQDVQQNQFNVLNKLTSQIEFQLESLDPVLKFLNSQCSYYLILALSQSQNMRNNFNVCIGLGFVYIFVYWIFSARKNYLNLIQQHQLAYQMYKIIGYNLRKDLEKCEVTGQF